MVLEYVGEISILGGEQVIGLFVGVTLAVEEHFYFLTGSSDEAAKGLIHFLDTRLEIGAFEAIEVLGVVVVAFSVLDGVYFGESGADHHGGLDLTADEVYAFGVTGAEGEEYDVVEADGVVYEVGSLGEGFASAALLHGDTIEWVVPFDDCLEGPSVGVGGEEDDDGGELLGQFGDCGGGDARRFLAASHASVCSGIDGDVVGAFEPGCGRGDALGEREAIGESALFEECVEWGKGGRKHEAFFELAYDLADGLSGVDTSDADATVYGDPGYVASGVFLEGCGSGGERPEGIESFGAKVVVGEWLAGKDVHKGEQ